MKLSFKISKTQRVLNSTDISMFEILPSEVLYPKNKNDIKKAILHANKQNKTIHARGCGTSTAGQSLGNGLLIDFSRYMNKVININNNYIDVEPGIVLGKLNERLKPLKKFMPVDPSSADVCSVGGMVANNSSGIHSYLYGDTKDYVLGLEGYFVDGRFFSTITGQGTKEIIEDINKLRPQAKELFNLVPKTIKNSSGYDIKEAFVMPGLDSLTRLIVGSEGTLCILTKIRLKIIQLPKERITILALFDDLERSLEAVNLSRNLKGISAIELLDKELIDVSRKNFSDIREYFNNNVKAGLLFEIDSDDPKDTKKILNELEKILAPIAIKVDTGYDQEKRKKLWWMRKSASSILNRIDGSSRTLRFIEDIAVPVDKVIEFYKEEKKILDSYGLPTAFFGHIGSGHFHINPKIDTRNSDFIKIIESISQQTYELVKHLNGTIAGEHGDGILRTPYIKKFDPELHAFFVKIKKTFDPKFILNPDKIVSINDATETNNRYLFDPVYKIEPEILNEIEKCHGCNECMTFCTSFISSDNNEGLKARGRANLLRAIINGLISGNELNEAIDYIEKCKLCTKCATMCPTGIDVTKVASLLREQKIIPISTTKRILMALMRPVRSNLMKKVKKAEKNAQINLNRLEVFIIKLGLYYRPYLKTFFEAVKEKGTRLVCIDTDIKVYLSRLN